MRLKTLQKPSEDISLDELIELAKEELDVKNFLGQGKFGVVYKIGDNHVLKIMKDHPHIPIGVRIKKSLVEGFLWENDLSIIPSPERRATHEYKMGQRFEELGIRAPRVYGLLEREHQIKPKNALPPVVPGRYMQYVAFNSEKPFCGIFMDHIQIENNGSWKTPEAKAAYDLAITKLAKAGIHPQDTHYENGCNWCYEPEEDKAVFYDFGSFLFEGQNFFTI
jgi:hypothetical protein